MSNEELESSSTLGDIMKKSKSAKKKKKKKKGFFYQGVRNYPRLILVVSYKRFLVMSGIAILVVHANMRENNNNNKNWVGV